MRKESRKGRQAKQILKAKRILLDRKGTAMVEAALVFPLVILSVAAVITIMIFLFEEDASTARVHIAANARMGKETETVKVMKNVPNKINVESGYKILGKCWIAEDELVFRGNGLLDKNFSKDKESYVYETDEKQYIRIVDFIK